MASGWRGSRCPRATSTWGAEGAQAQQATPELEREREVLTAIRSNVPLLICVVKVKSNLNAVTVDQPKNWVSLLPLVQHGAVFPVVNSAAKILPRTGTGVLSNPQIAWCGRNMRYVRDKIITMALSPEFQNAAGRLVTLPGSEEEARALTLLAHPRTAAVRKLTREHSADGGQYWYSFYERLCDCTASKVSMDVPLVPGAAAVNTDVIFKVVNVLFTNAPVGKALPALRFAQPTQLVLLAQPGPGNEQDDEVRAEDVVEDQDDDDELITFAFEGGEGLITQTITEHIAAASSTSTATRCNESAVVVDADHVSPCHSVDGVVVSLLDALVDLLRCSVHAHLVPSELCGVL